MDGKRCGEKCNGSTLKNAIVYFPPGTYLVHKPIISVFGTQIIGDVSLQLFFILATAAAIGLLHFSPIQERLKLGGTAFPCRDINLHYSIIIVQLLRRPNDSSDLVLSAQTSMLETAQALTVKIMSGMLIPPTFTALSVISKLILLILYMETQSVHSIIR